jgi:hypothetical protein
MGRLIARANFRGDAESHFALADKPTSGIGRGGGAIEPG